jgi:hypothetical protein
MITLASFNRAYGWSGDPSCVLYRSENVVIGSARQVYTWVAFAKEYCIAMVLRVSSQMLRPVTFRKGVALQGLPPTDAGPAEPL